MSLAVIDDREQVLELTTEEQTELALCEAVVLKGRQTFLEVGGALLTIQKKRLYRGTHDTFEDYCREVHDISRSSAYALITAFGISENVQHDAQNLPPIANARQALALRNVPEEERQEVYREAVQTAPEGKLTAAHVQAVADCHTRKTEQRAEVEAEKEAQAEATVQDFMDAPNVLPGPDESAEKATVVDYPTALALGRCLSLNVLKGEIGPQVLLNGKLWVTEKAGVLASKFGGKGNDGTQQFECLAVMDMDTWIDKTHWKPVHYTERDAEVEKGERDRDDIAGLKVVWISAPRDTSAYFVLTGERQTFRFVPRSESAKAATAERQRVPESKPEPKAEPQPEPGRAEPDNIPPGNTGAQNPDTRSELERIHATLSCRLDHGVLLTCRPEDIAEVMDKEAFVDFWLEFLANVQQSLANEREMVAVLQVRLNEAREANKAAALPPDPTDGQGEGIWVKNCDYKLLKQLAARKRPGQEEEVTPADYLTMMIEQRAALAGIAAEVGV